MRRRIFYLIIGLIITVISCKSTGNESSVPTPMFPESPIARPSPTAEALSPMTLEQGRAGITGRILVKSDWHDREVTIYASPFYSTGNENEGFFVLEPSIHPSSKLNVRGEFQLENIEPGFYVLIVGPMPDEAIAVQKSGTVEVFSVDANEVLDIGKKDLR